MLKSLFASSVAFLAFSFPAFAIDGCGPDQICTYKGRLKAGEACPASFCQGSSYYNGVAAAANGGVIRLRKKAAAEAPVATGAAQPAEAEKTVWKDPPRRAPKSVEPEAVPAFKASELKAAECRNLKVDFAQLSAECKALLNVEALGLSSGPEKFCRNTFAGDEAGYARCMGQDSAPEIDVNAIYKRMIRTSTGNLEKICRRANGDNEEGYQRCLDSRRVVNGRAGTPKAAAPNRGQEEAPSTSMSVDNGGAE
jgi:hypothetical protein